MSRRGMTLIEMMVALTATLLLMGAIAQVFSAFGNAVSSSRSVVDLDTRMRVVAWKLRGDLQGATAPMTPPLSPAADAGYFEIIEGPNTDTATYMDVVSGSQSPVFDKSGTVPGPNSASDDRIHGDTDDVLLFTTRSAGTPFLGRFRTGKHESSVAEVAWFLRPTRTGTFSAPSTSNPVTFTLHRRQLLVVGYVGAAPFFGGQNLIDTATNSGEWSTWDKFYGDFDLSVRGVKKGSVMTYMPNTLSDLTRRESRFMHNTAGLADGSGFPFAVSPVSLQAYPAPPGLCFDGTFREGEDVLLSNVIAFDVKVFDPAATYTAVDLAANGAYVDLGNGNTASGMTPPGPTPRFAAYGAAASGLAATSAWGPRVYDTWSTHYETDGVDQDASRGLGVDQGANGLDDNTNGVVDDGPSDLNGDGAFTLASEVGEMETSPPYPYPLRGIEVRIRCYEPSSRQVRQVTIRHTFVPL
jgi:prepilin-type N-terminal cleavage/methylation domain-containing protein